MADPLKVRALCKCGRLVTKEAPKGRSTWRGPCPKCGNPLIARRVRGEQPPPADPPAPDDQAPPAKSGGSKIARVREYHRTAPRRSADGGPSTVHPAGVDDGQGAGRPAGDDGAHGAAADGGRPEPVPTTGPAHVKRSTGGPPPPARRGHPYGHVVGAFGD